MRHTCLIILLFVILSCNQSNNGLFEIDPRNFTDNKITLSEMSDNILYIPLDNSFPIGNTYTLRITINNIYLSIKDVGIIKFNRDGEFICKIGSRGRGPAEYSYGMDFAVDERTGNVFVPDYGKVKIYYAGGSFIRDISYEGFIGGYGMSGGIETFNSLLFFPDYIMRGDSKHIWVFLDTLGNLVKKKENSVQPFHTDFSIEGSIYRFDNQLFYYNLFNDTIFSISSDLSYQGAYLFAQGEHRWPRSIIGFSSESQLVSQLYRLFQPEKMFETKHYIVLIYGYLDKAAISLIEKKTKRIFLAYKYQEAQKYYRKSKPWIQNDLDGGMPLTEINYLEEDGHEYITTLVNPFDLKVHVSSNEFINSAPKYPEKKKELEQLANSLKETDNPVLVLVRLKK